MNRSTVGSRWNLDVIDSQYSRWRADPASVDETWRAFFEGFELGGGRNGAASAPGVAAGPAAVGAADPGCDNELEFARHQAAVTRLIISYREVGHYLADLDPLKLQPRRHSHDLLEPREFGLTEADLDHTFYNRLTAPPHATLRQLITALRETYCRTVGVEFMHIRDPKIRDWLIQRMEPNRNRPNFDLQKKRRILWKLNAAELFETFLHKHYTGQKRFSLEGGEMLIPLLDTVIERAGKHGVREIVMGMPHRGRLNVLANILDKPFGMIFSEFEGNLPKTAHGDGDVKYHLGFSDDRVLADGHVVHVSLTPNPSHLEAVNPVVEGRVRAKQRRLNRDRKLGLPILIHGDAAFAGQGLVAETLNLSQLPGYETGGTVHIVVNNQIGFTTAPHEGRSTSYCTDVAKMIEVPIFHVNGEDPEAVVYVAELALDFRQTFGRDVVIDMVCYRKHGHNEGDEPLFTQPVMYKKIKDRPSIKELYTEHLILRGDLTVNEAETLAETFQERLLAVYNEVHDAQHQGPVAADPHYDAKWAGLRAGYSFEPVETGVPLDRLQRITEATAQVPEGFHRNPKLDRILGTRVKTMEANGAVDWGFAENLAFGSLLLEGTPVRLSGQDSRRGTFSQRHAALTDFQTGDSFIPLNHISPDQANLCVYNSMLSEAAVLGFDYGYTLDEPHMLIMWEAQFGDFVNGAQVIIDQFIASAESKWGRASGIVLLLPHGYEGQGPEHSSARIERFLQLCAEDNMQVVNCSTPAQYFHVLRRQVRREFRKPLIIFTPKSLLRHKLAVSPVEELVSGRFHEILDDATIEQPERVRRVVMCSGKVYYDLLAQREAAEKTAEVAIVRVEQLYPWPADAVREAVGRYRNAREFVWAQEESQNNAGWTFAAPRLRETTGHEFDYVGRDASASPATGSHHVHEREQAELAEAAIAGSTPHIVSATSHSHAAGADAVAVSSPS
jgi:2-oxoglutarate dehydrogenase E1 component